MLYKFNNQSLEPIEYYDYSDIKGKEKDLENLLANHLGDLFVEDSQLMPIFQERQRQPEPDLCALDKDGNLIIFELKRGMVLGDTTIQIMRYAQDYGQMNYYDLNQIYQKYIGTNKNLIEAHAENFGLEKEKLTEESFNKKQKLIIVGSSSDKELMDAVVYWQSQGIDMDFLPYRFYQINSEIFFEFFAKPFDFHYNLRDSKGIIFDTNRSYDENSIYDMFKNSKVSAYGNAARYVKSFSKGDYVFYYHVGMGIVGAGIIKNSTVHQIESQEELYRDVELLTPPIGNEKDIKCISASEIQQILDKNFYFASTIKSPYLSKQEAEKLIDELIKRYKE